MGSILLALLFNPGTLWTIAGLCGLFALIYFTLGPDRAFKLAGDIRLWFIAGLVMAVMAFAHTEDRAKALERKLDAAAQQQTADKQAQASQERRAAQRETRRTQQERIRERIDAAPEGEKLDAALDAIAAENPDHGDEDAVLDRRSQKAQPAPDGGAAADEPGADRVRKPSDVVVVP
ncbi:putative inner membrane spanin protein [Brevundimonas phage vB_BpoS-Gurke]|uniref:Inner membrane spanin protein n=1 Tax=Brevundimonas phage vB_BpoS-Gurke TaxID=2948599 RepID=A0A9E7N3T1_9CAUD|nr:putative inner membrane spanin protein [Brevundimonas phage vB_BpoS-Gurke]